MDYTYISASVKAKSSEFLTVKDYLLLSQTDKLEFTKTLSDFGYGYINIGLEELINQEGDKLLSELKEWLGENHYLLKAWRFQADIINIKIIIKELLFTKTEHKYLVPNGLYNYEALLKALKDENYDLVSNDKELFEKINQFKADKSPREISDYIVKTAYTHLYENYLKNDFYLSKYYEIKVTLINVLSLLRSIRLEENFDIFSESILEGGLIDKSILKEIYKTKNKLSFSKIKLFLPLSFEKTLESIDESTDINHLKREFERLTYEYLRSFEHEIKTTAPLLVYLFKKIVEIKNIKKIYYDSLKGHDDIFIFEG
ncbi:MAG: V-type ATPase subunit [Erysipelotrichales bacterium]|nr:V-type ATPase subunit [Erysipelotrichales bacterium]